MRILIGFALLITACSDNNGSTGGDAGVDAAAPDLQVSCSGGTCSNIKHLVVVIQENHTFDSYFGKYCTAPTGSNPTCTTGAACCEAGPAKDPGTNMDPIVLDDTSNGAYDNNHLHDCEVSEIDGGKMDKFISSTVSMCGNAKNFAYADPAGPVKPYIDLVKSSALADRYFQPYAGQSSANDMYFARAGFLFADNQYAPDSIGIKCSFVTLTKDFTVPSIGDLMNNSAVSWSWYGSGYQIMVDALTGDGGMACPPPNAACVSKLPFWPCNYDVGDVPFQYFPSLRDNPKYFKDGDQFAKDVSGGTLPAVSFLKPYGFQTEHPGFGITVSDGATFVTGVVNAIAGSNYAANTLILITYDEGGGLFDHVAPPPTSGVDQQDYGTRVPLIAVGTFARANYVSHVTMEHSSIVKFIEWNFLGGTTGQLGTRDAVVNNIGSLLDPAKTGNAVPQ